jgi:dipeptide/tripeptide permease
LKRSLAVVLALAMGLNGVVMLAAGRWWYGVVPGVTTTGPFNPHFVKDIGAAYLVAGFAFAWLAWKPAAAGAQGAAAAGAAFLALHAGVHLAEAISDPAGLAHLARDFPGVLLPALIAVWLAWPSQPRPETAHA